MEKDQMQEIAKPYRVVLEGGQGEFTEKKSRFIATVRPVKSEEEASAFIEEMKKTYWDASHNCSAFVIGKKAELTRCSDDGEPARTAGRPMLEVLLGEEIRNVAVVVTRYFGGTLLGTGGLVKAYGDAVKSVLEKVKTEEMKDKETISLRFSYEYYTLLKRLFEKNSVTIDAEDFNTDISITLTIDKEKKDLFVTEARDIDPYISIE